MLTDILLSVITSLGVVGAAAWLGRTWLGEKIKSEVAHTYDVRIEELRSELKARADRELELLRAQLAEARAEHGAITAAFSSAQSAAHERRLRAVEALWSKVVSTRTAINSLLVYFDVLTPEETASLLDRKMNEHMTSALNDLTWSRFVALFELGDNDHELCRPFVSEQLWTYFNGYMTLLARALIAYIQGKEKNQLHHWFEDSAAAGLLESLLTPQEADSVRRKQIAKLPQTEVLIEQRLLELARAVVSGQVLSDATMAETSRIKKAVAASVSIEELANAPPNARSLFQHV